LSFEIRIVVYVLQLHYSMKTYRKMEVYLHAFFIRYGMYVLV